MANSSDNVGSSRGSSHGPQLVDHLPVAENDALLTFTRIPDNIYQYNSLGRSRQNEECMVCDCQYEYGVDDPDNACGLGADCINRLTQVECLAEECRCRNHCRNQRFQQKQYGNIEIVLTEKKGFGLRATADMEQDTFIYEYIGEVVSQPSFLKRMREYAEEGIKHFYFMMLQREEYIDATKKGGIGRFANHSCNPNCYVAKWVVGPRVRMGIFAKRKIRRGEELTFNYNVDRYGHDAQPCYCGEASCVGFIGGKTQTDISGMDDLYIDALGIADDVEQLSLKGTTRKKGRRLDEDFVPILTPVSRADVPKVVAAMRQATSRRIIHKLLTRIRMTDVDTVQRELMRLRGYSIMASILEDYPEDEEIVTLALESMAKWPLQNRNKVEDANIEVPVARYKSSTNGKLRLLSEELLQCWAALESAYRIPKRALKALEGEDSIELSATDTLSLVNGVGHESPRPAKRLRMDDDIPVSTISIQPLGFRSVTSPTVGRSTSSLTSSSASKLVQVAAPMAMATVLQPVQSELAAIIAQAAAASRSLAATVESPEQKPQKHSNKSKTVDPSKAKSSDPAQREKRLSKLVSEVVVSCMSKHLAKHGVKLDKEEFKKYAKDLTNVIADKEKKSSSYQQGKLDRLSEEKETKIKKFVKAYLAKVSRRTNGRSNARLPLPAHDSSGTPEESVNYRRKDETVVEDSDRGSPEGTLRELALEEDGYETDHEVESRVLLPGPSPSNFPSPALQSV